MRGKGLALILVVGVLGVLAVLGSAFAVLSRLERRAAAQRVLGTQAELLARSGIEDALARIGGRQDPIYGGENWDASADGMLSSYEAAQQSFRITAAGTRADVETCPARHAMRPSWFARAAGGDPAVRPMGGKERGWSGALGGGFYALKAEAGGFHVNSMSRRILGILAEALDREDGSDDALPVDQADGESLADARPAAGWGSWTQIRDGALGGSQARMDALRPYLALEAWVDRKVIAANLDPAKVGSLPHSWMEIKRWRLGTPEPGLEPRAPVSLSWARRHRAALIALLAGLKGVYLDESTGDMYNIGTLRSAEIVLDWSLPSDECRDIADGLLISGSDLSTWDRFNEYCDSILFSGTSDLPQAKRDLLKANFNPNSDLNKTNPDPAMARRVDKSDLLVHSTELDLLPGTGAALSSVGRILDRGGRILAQRELTARAAPSEAFRLTTQGEFVASDLGDLSVAGDESGFRDYGEARFIPESQGTGRTYGHRMATTGFLDGDSVGVSLQTYPEPHPVWTSPATGRPAVYDGRVALATVELPSATSQLFLARWASGFDSDDAGGVSPNYPWYWETGLTPSCPVFGSDLAPPGILNPDGVYVEEGDWEILGSSSRTPAYRATGNIPAFNGTVSFWVKPSWQHAQGDGALTQRGHIFFNPSLQAPLMGAKFAVGAVYDSMISPGGGTQSFALWYRSKNCSSPSLQERAWAFQPVPGILRHRWRLITCCWDLNVNTLDSGRLWADRGTAPNVTSACQNLDDLPPFGALPLNTVGNRITFGPGERFPILGKWFWPDATLDEVGIYDFGAAPDQVQAQLDSVQLDQTRFKEGRFYKESLYAGLGAAGNKAGEWFSAPIRLEGARLAGVSWTQVVPRGLRAPAVADLEDGDAGPDGRILLELVDATGTDYLRDGSGRPLLAFGAQSAFTPVGRRIEGAFRLHAVFQPNVADLLNKAILDPLVLDDVTLTYGGTAGPRITSWGED